MKRIIVIGSPGAGKSTFARQLRDITGLPLYYLDMIWHLPDRTTITKDEFDHKLMDILKTDTWIIDGNYGRTIEMRLKYCDTVFLLDYPLEVCLAGAKARVGKKREEIPWVEEELDEEFRQWIIDFPETKLPQIYELLKQYGTGKEIHIFRAREDANKYLESIDGKNRKCWTRTSSGYAVWDNISSLQSHSLIKQQRRYAKMEYFEIKDFYIDNKKKFKRLSIVSGILLAVFFLMTVVFYVLSNNQHLSYKVVQVKVISVDIGNPLNKIDKDKVVVEYNGKNYEVENLMTNETLKYHTYLSSQKPADAYFANGRIFANVDGIRSTSRIGMIYFVFLFGTLILIFTTAVLGGCVIEAKKREKGIYPDKYVGKHGQI